MIGFGNTVPRTNAGKITVIFYAVLGIPVYVLYLMNMGKTFSKCLKWIYTKVSAYLLFKIRKFTSRSVKALKICRATGGMCAVNGAKRSTTSLNSTVERTRTWTRLTSTS